jgi:hypothetical protein
VLVLRIVESLGWVFACSLGGERWDEKEEEGETEEESVGGWGYIMVFSSVIPSVMPSVKEPRHLSLNPSVMPVGKIT